MKSQSKHLALLSQNYVPDDLIRQQKYVDRIADVSRSISLQVCNSCKSTSLIFDEPKGETVCTDCGIVILEKQMTLEKALKTQEGSGMPFSLAYPDKGLSTIITFSNTDANGTSLNQGQLNSINKIRYYDRLSDSKSHVRNLKNAFSVMAALKDKLNLTDPIIERSAYYYRKTLGSGLIKGRSIKEMVVASVYAACKEMDIPRRLEDISEAADADKIFAGRCFRIISRELSINTSNVDANRFLSKVAENAGVKQKTYRTALDMLDMVKKDTISYGKDPKALAAAALYAACLIEDEENTSQAKLAQAGGISVVTLRKRFLDISKLFPEMQIELKKVTLDSGRRLERFRKLS
jgi:transcription initiation factor TFIIB